MKTKRKFLVTFKWDPESQQYVADVPELPGCVTTGDTIEEARRHAVEAMGLWLDVASDYADPRPGVSWQEIEIGLDSKITKYLEKTDLASPLRPGHASRKVVAESRPSRAANEKEVLSRAKKPNGTRTRTDRK